MINKLGLLIVLSMLILSGCGTSAPEKAKPIKIAALPVLDVFPLYVAEAQGYFKNNGVEVELIPVGSAPERDQLMQAGQIDGMLSETVTTLYYNRESTKVAIVRFARTATEKDPVFRILASKSSEIKSVQDLRGIPIGISEGTIIEYMTDRVLQKAGLKPEEIAKIAVPKITDRMTLLNSGDLKAANLPDPLASLAMQNGAVLIIDDTTYPEVSNSVYAFREKTIKENPAAVRSFLAAIEQAVKDINSDKMKWNSLLAEKKLVPPQLLSNYTLPDFPTASVPTEAQFKDTVAWAKGKGLIKTDISYQTTVDASFLPKK
jgi:NitT/TauT family transport system substrate-binding protein